MEPFYVKITNMMIHTSRKFLSCTIILLAYGSNWKEVCIVSYQFYTEISN